MIGKNLELKLKCKFALKRSDRWIWIAFDVSSCKNMKLTGSFLNRLRVTYKNKHLDTISIDISMTGKFQ